MSKKRQYSYDYPMFAAASDTVVFSLRGDPVAVDDMNLSVLLIRRGSQTLKGQWALPGGFVRQDESHRQAALRELEEETGIYSNALYDVGEFSEPGRDPRPYRVISMAFYCLLAFDQPLSAGSDAADVKWFSVQKLPRLAFDHKAIIKKALTVLSRDAEIDYSIASQFLPHEFTLREARLVLEKLGVLPEESDPGNFHKWIKGAWPITPTKKMRKEGNYRPSRLFSMSVQ